MSGQQRRWSDGGCPFTDEKFGRPSRAFFDMGRDTVITWYILTNDFKDKKLSALKIILSVSTAAYLFFLIFIVLVYIIHLFSNF